MELIYITGGLVLGAIIGWFYGQRVSDKKKDTAMDRFTEADRERAVLGEKLKELREAYTQLQRDMENRQTRIVELSTSLATESAERKNTAEKLVTHQEELLLLHNKMKEQFENIASKIVFDNSQRIQQQHKEKLDDILNPLKEKIEKFESKVDQTHKENVRENQSLKEQLAMLQKLNQTIGDEARNLTTALKGQSKTQGTWGELILEKVLEKSGLIKGREYVVQESITMETGRRMQPDVVINLPDKKNLVIDSKLSLVAYERYCNSETEAEKLLALKEHLISVRKHIRDLGDKNYHHLYEVNSLDFVLMFIPLEPAFAAAVEADQDLFNEAFDRNIVLVTTSTLLATLKTIASIWRVEYQSRNAMEIARQGGDLYDKFVGLINELLELGKKMKDSQRAYEETMVKLTGRGNLVNRVEQIKKLGAKTSKTMPPAILQRAEENDTLFDE